ncbi:heavy-metal-associated domain-containing protein [Fundicoccus sp. Sow4_H7]|uniref:heavy-metal-associated domain-containing protein n=1 Tax=Fundicoccus sp. Sow4_H7 TaxID=3438784 RepID=UPI003F916F6B
MEKIFNVKKMGCQNCANTITRALNKLDGVEKVDVSLQNKTASVQYDGAKIQTTEMVKAVADAGYELVE